MTALLIITVILFLLYYFKLKITFGIVLFLIILYGISFMLLAGVGMSNERTDQVLRLGERVYFFINQVLSYPIKLLNADYPFFLDYTHEEINPVKSIFLAVVNFILQILILRALIYLLSFIWP